MGKALRGGVKRSQAESVQRRKWPFKRRALPGQQLSQDLDGLDHSSERPFLLYAHPIQELARARSQSQTKASAGQLIKSCCIHGDLRGIERIGVVNAAADVDAFGVARDRGKHHCRTAQEKIVAQPELVETGALCRLRQRDGLPDRQVVVQAYAEAQVSLPRARRHR